VEKCEIFEKIRNNIYKEIKNTALQSKGKKGEIL
jgi:hypothetical protein